MDGCIAWRDLHSSRVKVEGEGPNQGDFSSERKLGVPLGERLF